VFNFVIRATPVAQERAPARLVPARGSRQFHRLRGSEASFRDPGLPFRHPAVTSLAKNPFATDRIEFRGILRGCQNTNLVRGKTAIIQSLGNTLSSSGSLMIASR
jgi:hypothetical protein